MNTTREINFHLKLRKKLEIILRKVYSTVIPRNVRLSEALHGMPVLIYDKSCPGSKSYFNFTMNLLIKKHQ